MNDTNQIHDETLAENSQKAPHENFVGRNVGLLAFGQAIAGSNQALVMAVGALTGVILAPDARFATLPTTAMIVGLALFAGPAAVLLHRFGRKQGFILGGLIAIIAGIMAAWAITIANFALFCIALAVIGMSAAFGQQYRFAVADSVPEAFRPRAISYVMFGGVAAGFLGPRLAYETRFLLGEQEFAGSFLMVSVMSVLTIGIILFTRLAPPHKVEVGGDQGRSYGQLLRDPEIFVPIISGMATYALMTFVMVAAPLAMVHICGHPVGDAATTIQWHIISMFAPSFVTPMIIKRLGAHLTTGIGLALILVCAAVNLNGITTLHFNIALILLGIGWNFGFIGSTALLTNAYRKEEAARAQALNEQLVFGTMAVGSIGSGIVLNLIGWEAVNILVIPVATAAIAILAWGEAMSRRAKAA